MRFVIRHAIDHLYSTAMSKQVGGRGGGGGGGGVGGGGGGGGGCHKDILDILTWQHC